MTNERFDRAWAAFDAAHDEDPTRVEVDGAEVAAARLHADRLSAWVTRLAPDASEALRLAARSQHLRRWAIPRASYPMDRVGYLAWRKALARHHADQAEEILRAAGYGDDVVEAVRRINMKRNLKRDPDVQVIEDALCLTFLEHELGDFAARHERAKVIDILQKTWGKMSDEGHVAALALPLPPEAAALVGEALGG